MKVRSTDDGRNSLAAGFSLLALLAVGAGCAAYAPPEGSDAERAERTRKADAGFRVAMLLVADLKCAEAVRELLPLIQEFDAIGDRARAAEAAFWTGYCHEKLDDAGKARAFYDLAVKQYPNTPASRLAADRLTRIGREPVP